MRDRTENLSRGMMRDAVLVFLVFLFAFLYAFNNIVEADVFWHLKLGQYILSTGSIPFRDIFSYTLAGTKTYPVEWLFEVIWYVFYFLGGITGLVIVKAALAGITSVVLFLSFKRYGINRYAGFAIIAGIFITAGSYFVNRPQIITYLGIALFVFITAMPDIEKKKAVWLIPLLMLLWVNMHAGAVFGLFYVFAWLTEGFFLLLKRHLSSQVFRKRLIITFLAFLATFITPSTYHLYGFLFSHVVSLGTKSGLEFITEFMPPSLSQKPVMFAGLAVFTFLFAAGLFKMPLRYALFGIVMLPLSFDMQRMVIMALIGTACGTAMTADRVFSRMRTMKKAAWLLVVVYAACLVLPFSYELYQWKTDFAGDKGIGIQGQFYPDSALHFIRTHHIKGNIYNAINFGGAVIFRGYPEIKDFIDTRLAPERLLLTMVNNAMNNAAEFGDLMNKYKVAYALVETYLSRDYGKLFPAPLWHLVYFDDYAQIYVRSGTGNDTLIRNYSYDVFDPYTFLYTYEPLLSPAAYFTKPGLPGELRRLAGEAPSSAMAHLAYGLALIYNGSDYADGLHQIDTARRIQNYNPRVLLWYGIEHGLNGDAAAMVKSFHTLDTVLGYQKGASVRDRAFIRYIMGYYYYLAGLDSHAQRSLRCALRIDPQFSMARALLERIP